jgi:hypothetical protein
VADTLSWRTNATYMIKSETKIPATRCRLSRNIPLTPCSTGR